MRLWLFIALVISVFQSYAQRSDFAKVNFHKADSIALEYKNEGLYNLPLLSHNLTSSLSTDVEKFRAIFKWVSSNISNDYGLFEINQRKRQRYKNDSLKLEEWNGKFRKKSFKKLLRKQRTICSGYAYLVKKLSDLSQIECQIIQGFAKTSTIDVSTLDMPNHAWNAVKLNGKWYLCDPTWASGTPHPETNKFEFNYNDGFFLASPELFAINHFPVEQKWLLLENNNPTYQDFLDAPIIYGKTYSNLNAYSQPQTLFNTVNKYQKVTFKCELSKTIDVKDVKLMLDNGSSSKTIHPENTTINHQTLTIEYSFDRTGIYDVHLMIGTDLISSHTFEVKG